MLAWQKLMEQLQRDKKLAVYPVLRSKDRPEGEAAKPIPFADVEKHFVAASDAYVANNGNEDRAPGVSYKAAELYYAHNDFPEARKRFEAIIGSYPRNEVAKFATNLIVESYLIDKDWKSVEEVSARLAKNSAVIDPKSDLYKDLNKFKLAGRFKLADELMAKGDYDNAAKKYIELVDEDPKNEFADKALNNAAVCYENTRRFESRAQALRAHLPRVPQQQAGRRRALPGGRQRREQLRLRQGGGELPAPGEGLPGEQEPRGRPLQRRAPAGRPAAVPRCRGGLHPLRGAVSQPPRTHRRTSTGRRSCTKSRETRRAKSKRWRPS